MLAQGRFVEPLYAMGAHAHGRQARLPRAHPDHAVASPGTSWAKPRVVPRQELRGRSTVIWDRIFGAYAEEIAPPVFRLRNPSRATTSCGRASSSYAEIAGRISERQSAGGAPRPFGPLEWDPDGDQGSSQSAAAAHHPTKIVVSGLARSCAVFQHVIVFAFAWRSSSWKWEANQRGGARRHRGLALGLARRRRRAARRAEVGREGRGCPLGRGGRGARGLRLEFSWRVGR